MQHAAALQQDKNLHDSEIELFRSVLLAANNTVKACLIINGAAALALLTFIGKIATEAQAKYNVSDFSTALLIFCLGVFISAISGAGVYFSQFYYHQELGYQNYAHRSTNQEQKQLYKDHSQRSTKIADRFRGVTIAAVTLSFILFAVGTYISYNAFKSVVIALV